METLLRGRLKAQISCARRWWLVGVASLVATAWLPSVFADDNSCFSIQGAIVKVAPEIDERRYSALSELKKLAATEGRESSRAITLQIPEPSELSKAERDHLTYPDAMILSVNGDRLDIYVADAATIPVALTTLFRHGEKHEGCVPEGRYLERPLIARRGLHVVVRHINAAELRGVLRLAERNRFNFVVMQLTADVGFKSFPRPEDATPTISVEELKGLLELANKAGLEIIPEIQLLSHQEKLFQDIHPELMFNARTYDPRNPDVYRLVYPLIDEVLEVFRPKAFHIGHDEVLGWSTPVANRILGEGYEMLPANLFMASVLRLSGYLAAKGVQTWMWGDMLLDPADFTEKVSRSMHGGVGQYPKLLGDLPKDLVVVHWKYFDQGGAYPGFDRLRQAGFRAIGATWKEVAPMQAFAKHVHASEGRQSEMLSTVWYFLQLKDWQTVRDIVRQSGDTFWQGSNGSP